MIDKREHPLQRVFGKELIIDIVKGQHIVIVSSQYETGKINIDL